MTDKVWLHLAETGGYFHCPVDAAKAWMVRGWVECEAPPEANPALAEWVPYETPAAPEAAVPDEPAETKTTKNRRVSVPESTEGVNDVG